MYSFDFYNSAIFQCVSLAVDHWNNTKVLREVEAQPEPEITGRDLIQIFDAMVNSAFYRGLGIAASQITHSVAGPANGEVPDVILEARKASQNLKKQR